MEVVEDARSGRTVSLLVAGASSGGSGAHRRTWCSARSRSRSSLGSSAACPTWWCSSSRLVALGEQCYGVIDPGPGPTGPRGPVDQRRSESRVGRRLERRMVSSLESWLVRRTLTGTGVAVRWRATHRGRAGSSPVGLDGRFVLRDAWCQRSVGSGRCLFGADLLALARAAAPGAGRRWPARSSGPWADAECGDHRWSHRCPGTSDRPSAR